MSPSWVLRDAVLALSVAMDASLKIVFAGVSLLR
jgi:hypothetical protein